MHKSEVGDSKSVTVDSFKEGQAVRAKILKINEEKKQLSLGLKASYFKGLPEEPEEEDESATEPAESEDESEGTEDPFEDEAPASSPKASLTTACGVGSYTGVLCEGVLLVRVRAFYVRAF